VYTGEDLKWDTPQRAYFKSFDTFAHLKRRLVGGL